MGEFIEIENLVHSFPLPDQSLRHALACVNLSIAKGSFVAIIGTNGSGKSTLAKHLNGLLLPTDGQVLINGQNTKDEQQLWRIRQQVGMVFQNPDNQIVAAMVEEDVAFGPENLGVPTAEIQQRVTEALAKVGMSEYRFHGPHLLSGGQKQRIAIAGVLAMKPACIVLDEPTAMLDPKGRREVMATVKQLHKQEGLTCILITHFMEEAVLADRVVVMESGKVVLDGTPAQIFSQVQKLKQLGLDVPVAAELADHLRQAGLSVAPEIITNKALVKELCRFN